MRSLAVTVMLLLVAISVTDAQNKKRAVSDELTVNGITCTYNELMKGGLRRGIMICSCKEDPKARKQRRRTGRDPPGGIGKSCEYFGPNPHNCTYYNKNQQAYYKLLASSAMENGAPCAKPNIQEEKCGLTYPCYSGDCPGAVGNTGPCTSRKPKSKKRNMC